MRCCDAMFYKIHNLISSNDVLTSTNHKSGIFDPIVVTSDPFVTSFVGKTPFEQAYKSSKFLRKFFCESSIYKDTCNF